MDSSSRALWRRIADDYAPLVFLGALIVTLSATTRAFAAPDNLINIARQHAIIIVLAVGQTMVMISGGIDLSVGSVMALSAVVAAHSINTHLPIPICLLTGVCTGIGCGLVNGLVTTKARVPAFIATLGMMGMARGLALVASGGVTVNLPSAVREWSSARGAMAFLFIGITAAVAVLTHVMLTSTVLGKRCYAIGGNREAARLSGIDIDRHLIIVFTLNGLVCGLAGMMLLGYTVLGDPTAGYGYELDSVAAAVIGGTSLFGGRGNVGGTVVGAFILAVLRNGCDLRSISEHWQRFIVGLMTIVAVFYDRIRRKE